MHDLYSWVSRDVINFSGGQLGSALDDIELTYHDVTVFAIPEFKSLEVLKNYFL